MNNKNGVAARGLPGSPASNISRAPLRPKSFAEIGSIATSAAPGARSAAAGRRRNTAAIGAVAAIHRQTSVLQS